MKLSNRLLLVLAAAILFLVGSYGFYIGKNIEPVKTITRTVDLPPLEFVGTIRNRDTSYFDFEHIVFEMERIRAVVNMTPDLPSGIVFENYFKNLERADLFEFEVNEDTLYVREILDIFQYKFSTEMTKSAKSFNSTDIKLHIYTNNLKSITFQKSSNVKVQGLSSNGKRYFLPELTVKQKPNTIFKIENLDLGTLNHHQNMDEEYQFPWTSVYLDNGAASRLNFYNLNTELDIFDFPADSVYVKESPENQHMVKVHANEYLNVDLADKSNGFVYKGNPKTIIKKERGLGRLINGNLPSLN